jgi:hypothetical protein
MMGNRSILALLALTLSGCHFQDPRAPLDDARREIDTIQANQQQAGPLLLLQQDLQRTLLADPHVRTASVGLYYASRERSPYSAVLVVKLIILMEMKDAAPAEQDPVPASQPAAAPSLITESPQHVAQDVVRKALKSHGWDVEQIEDYQYKQQCRVVGEIRGAGLPPSAGAGLDILPMRSP